MSFSKFGLQHLAKNLWNKASPIHVWFPMMAAAAAVALTVTGCSRQSLTTAVYSCNIEFKGQSEEAHERVAACRRGARIAYETTVEMASEVAKLVSVLEGAAFAKTQVVSDIDFDESGSRVPEEDPQVSALTEISTEVMHRAQSRCQTVFRRKADGRLACMAGIRNFRAREFEKIFLSSVDAGELKKQLDAAGISLGASTGHEERAPAAH
jgi:hypothetical protein